MAGRRKKLKRPSLGAFRGTMALLTPALPTCRRGGHSVALNHTHHTLSQQSWETNSAGSDCSLSRHCAGHNTLKEATFATSAVGQEAVVTFGSLSQVHRRAVGPPQAERPSQSHGGGGHLHWPLSQAETSLHREPLTLWEPCACSCMMGTPGPPSHRLIQRPEEVKVATAFRESDGFFPPRGGGSRPRQPGDPTSSRELLGFQEKSLVFSQGHEAQDALSTN